MRIKAIEMDTEELPELITVEMTLAEAVLIGKHVGSVTPSTVVSTNIWDSLTGGVFNRFWDDGIDETCFISGLS